MDLGSVLVGLGVLMVFMAPIFWLQWSGKSNKEKRTKRFKTQALALGIDIDHMAMWCNNYCLGIGNKGQALLYLNEHQPSDPFMWIDLTTVTGCKLAVESHKAVRDNESIVVVDRISLVFSFHNANTPSRSISIFDWDADPSISDQLVFAKEWEERISAVLKTSAPVLRRTGVAA